VPPCKRPVRRRQCGPGRSIGGHHVRARIGGHHRSFAIPGCDAGALGGLCAAEPGAALPGRSADSGGDHPSSCAKSGPGPYADRLRGLIAILWRAGLRISEALALTESDLDPKTGSVLVRAGKGGKRRMVGMNDWGWEHVSRWTEHRIGLPIGPLFCILAGPTRGRGWSATEARGGLRRLAAQAGVRRRFAPHQLRHAHAIEMAHEGIPLPIIQRQLGHAHLGITSI
jgi:integrase